MLFHVQDTTLTPSSSFGSVAGRLSALPYIPLRGMDSFFAQFISHNCPSAYLVFLVTILIIPSHPFIFVRQFVFHAESQGFFTDISVKTKGEFLFFACPTRKSRSVTSSMAKLMNIRLFDMGFLSLESLYLYNAKGRGTVRRFHHLACLLFPSNSYVTYPAVILGEHRIVISQLIC